MKILALDLGKSKTVSCTFEIGGTEQHYRTVRTAPATLHDLIVEIGPSRVVFEIGPSAGWLADVVTSPRMLHQICTKSADLREKSRDNLTRMRLAKQAKLRRPTMELTHHNPQ